MLFGKPKCFDTPLSLIRRPLDFEMPDYLWYQLAHFHDGYVFPNARS